MDFKLKTNFEILNPNATIAVNQYYYVNDLVSIYNIPEPSLLSTYVVGVVSFGGGLYGNIDSNGVMINDTFSDIYNYWKKIGMTSFPTVVIKLLNGATNNISDLNSTLENSLDVEIIGGTCPSSNLIIILYIGPNIISQFNTTLNYIYNTPISVNGNDYIPNAICISWGAPESNYGTARLNQINSICQKISKAGITICVSSGDHGSSDGLYGNNLDFPSSSPYVTSVGGTSLYCPQVNSAYNYTNFGTTETAWSNGGGGFSRYFAKPTYQSSITGSYRSSPDIALSADPNNGVYILASGTYYILGGTSMSAPLFAGFLASINCKVFVTPYLYINPTVYHDITDGTNGSYSAKAGYDNCTGWGSIDGKYLESVIVSNNIIIPDDPPTEDIVCLSGNTSILMADNSFKKIKDIQRGDFVVTDKKIGSKKQVVRIVSSFCNSEIINIPKDLLGNNNDIIITKEHPIWVNNDKNRVYSKNIAGTNLIYVNEIVYNIQFEEEGTYYAENIRMDSLSPNFYKYKLSRDQYFNKTKYNHYNICNEDDPKRNKPKMLSVYTLK